MDIGDRISRRRKELGLTLEQVGDSVGVGKSTVRKWETGYIENMKRDKIALLAKALDISPLYLMGWSGNPNPETPITFNDSLLSSPGIRKDTGKLSDTTSPEELSELHDFIINQNSQPSLDDLSEILNQLPIDSYKEIKDFLMLLTFKYNCKKGD